LKAKGIIGIDLAGKPKNPTGWGLWKNKKVETSLIHTNKEILDDVAHSDPTIIAIDAPFSLPKKGILRIADREMIRRGYRVFPPCLPAMKTLTLRAMKLNKLMAKKRIQNNRGAPYINTQSIKHAIERLAKDSNNPRNYRFRRRPQTVCP